MKAKYLVLLATLLMAASLGYAQSESMRPLFCKENRMPELHAFEIDLLSSYAKYDESQNISGLELNRTDLTLTPKVRFGAYENLALYATVPFSFIRSDINGNFDHFKDVTVGAELLAYEYTYKYPWVIPYVEVTLPTGDENDYTTIKKTDSIFGYGLGEVDAIFGVAVGTTVNDVCHYILDGRYDTNSDDNGIFSGAACFIWDLSDQFSFLAEAKVCQEPNNTPYSGVPAFFNGGLSYTPFESLRCTAYGGTSVNTAEEGHGALKIAYMF